MINALKKFFGFGPQTDYAALVKRGALIVDVRSKAEYQGGHIKGSINIPVDVLRNNIAKLDKSKPIITCCASGMRSSSAKHMLKSNGFTEVYNGGGWMSLEGKLG
ncbi:MAG: rhodanese-like domain-containing protein [Bacteroidota bacterium]|jgi:rhodanese-related sulfurtransferase